ncbi:hypothetical protein IMSAGC005_00874 [Lachnospiraceae bacterium]|nr:hypothetical protein IMSAGC005_00874 [Lachnospiraceae bacterium]
MAGHDAPAINETGKQKDREAVNLLKPAASRRKERRLIIEINKDIEKYQESVAMGLSAKQLVYSILALLSGCLIVFLLYGKIGLTFSCYVTVPIVAPIALCGFYSYNGMGFREVFTRYMKSIFGNKALVFQSGGYREMRAEIHAKEEALKRAAVRKAKEERKQKNRCRINEIIKKCIRKTNRKGRGKKEQIY